jgi:hypothetical protein
MENAGQTLDFDPYWQWLRIPQDRRPPNYYDLLGLPPFEADQERIRAAYRERYHRVRRYHIGGHEDDAHRLIDELAESHGCLTSPERKQAYDRQLREEPPDLERTASSSATPGAASSATDLNAAAEEFPAPTAPGPQHAPTFLGPVIGRGAAPLIAADYLLGRLSGGRNSILHYTLRAALMLCVVALGALSVGTMAAYVKDRRDLARAEQRLAAERAKRQEALNTARRAAEGAERAAAQSIETGVVPASYERGKYALAEAVVAAGDDRFESAMRLFGQAGALFARARGEAPAANDLGIARQAWLDGLEAADSDAVDTYAARTFVTAAALGRRGRWQMELGQFEQATELYREALDTLNRAIAEAAAARKPVEVPESIVDKLETAIVNNDLAAANRLLAKVENLVPQDPRLAACREKVARLPPPETVTAFGSETPFPRKLAPPDATSGPGTIVLRTLATAGYRIADVHGLEVVADCLRDSTVAAEVRWSAESLTAVTLAAELDAQRREDTLARLVVEDKRLTCEIRGHVDRDVRRLQRGLRHCVVELHNPIGLSHFVALQQWRPLEVDMKENVAVLRYPDLPTTVRIRQLFLVNVVPTYLDLPPTLVDSELLVAGGTIRLSNSRTYLFGQPYDIAPATTRWPLDDLARAWNMEEAHLRLQPQEDGWVTLHFQTTPSAEEFSLRQDKLQRWARIQASEIQRLRRENWTINRDIAAMDGNMQSEDTVNNAYAAATRVARALKRRRPAHPGSPDDVERWERFRSEVQQLSQEVQKRNTDLRQKEQSLREEYARRAEELDSIRPPQANAITVHIFRTILVGDTAVRVPVVERPRKGTADR